MPSLGSVRTNTLNSGESASEFRSAYSLDKLYPSSTFNYSCQIRDHQTGFNIPVDRLKITYSRSSGPGGQNVNKVNTKAEVRFHIATADWLSEEVRQNILSKHKNKINKSGELIITSEVSRYQMRNLSDCLQKIQDMITEASYKPAEPSEEDAAFRRTRVEQMNRERLRQKKIASGIKQSRRVELD